MMTIVNVNINSIDKVKSFVNDLAKFDCDFDLVSGRYVVDAKSIMGIFSMDLSKPIQLNIHVDIAESEEVISALDKYIIK
ncbi:MAG: HPr family phosphocarrier protein [Lachnospiraceae bacterium]|nr:HPr family phosphocarrier protein [Lachnospiraceae bacterium]